MNSTERKNKRRKIVGSFYLWYAVICSVLLIGLTVGIAVFYDFIREYENSRPEHVVRDYILSLNRQDLCRMFEDEVHARFSGFEEENALYGEIDRAFGEGLVFTRCAGEEPSAYDVFCGERFMRVHLRQTAEGRYGFIRYEIEDCEFFPDWMDSRLSSVQVIVPAQASLSLNGIPVAPSYRTGERYQSAVLSLLEPTDPTLVEYAIKDVFGPIALSGEYNGQPLNFTRLDGSDLYYSDFDLPTLFSYTLKVPKDAQITFNGDALSRDFLTQTVNLPEAVSELEAAKAPLYDVYTISGMLTPPDVKASLPDLALEPIRTSQTECVFAIPTDRYTVRVPHGMRLYCNDVLVDSRYCADNAGIYESPDSDTYPGSEAFDLYTLSLYAEPAFRVDAAASVCEQEQRDFVFFPVPTESEEKELRAEAQLFTELFVKYSLQGGSKVVRANYDACMEHVLRGSEAYQTIYRTLDAFKYNSTYEIQKLETEVRDLIRYSDECFGVKVDFDSLGVAHSHEKPASGTYTMVWIHRDGQWKLAIFSL